MRFGSSLAQHWLSIGQMLSSIGSAGLVSGEGCRQALSLQLQRDTTQNSPNLSPHSKHTCSESSWWGHVWPQTQTNSLLMFYNSHNITRIKPIVNIYPTQIITRPGGKCHGSFTKLKGFCKRIIGWKLKLRISKNLHSFSHSLICLI